MATPAFQIPGLSPLTSGLILAGLGGLGSAFPTTTNVNAYGSGNTTTSGGQETVSSQNISELLKTLQEISSQQTQQQSQNTLQTTTPNLSPAAQGLIDNLTKQYQTLSTPDLRGYQASQIQGINRNADLQQQSVDNIMAARGLSTSPVAGTAAAGVENSRIGQINSFNQNLPMLMNQLKLGNLQAAGNFATSIPYGTTTQGGQYGTTSTTGTQQTTGSQQQDTTQQGKNYMTYGSGVNTTSNQQQQQKSGGGIGSAIGGIASILASLFSDERLKKDIKPTEKAVEKIMALKPVQWKWKGGEVQDAGVIAQDLAKEAPELVIRDRDTGFLKVNYTGLVGNLISAVQELNTKVEALGS